MKTKTTLLALLLGLASQVASAAENRLDVIFSQPEKFRDVKESDMGSDKERDALLVTLKTFLADNIHYYVAEGQKLTITVTDIDMAGDFEPWRGAEMSNVRIVKDIYPPRINLTFKLTDAEGKVLKEGERKLSDTMFLMRISLQSRSDPLRYEKALLEDWLRDDFPKPKSKSK